MFKTLLFAALLAFAAAKPGVGLVSPVAYSAPLVSAYSAYPAVSAYSAHGAYPAYSAYHGAYPAVSAYSAYPAVSAYSAHPVSAYSAYPYSGLPLAYSKYY